MKQKLSITINEETILLVEKRLEEGLFRNKSHMFEYAVKILLRKNE